MNHRSVLGLCDCTKAGLLLLFSITVSNVVYFIFVACNSLALPNPCMHGQRRIIAVRAPLALRKPLEQRPKMRPLARSQPPRATTTTTKLKRPTYMKRAHDAGVAECHTLVCAHSAKSSSRSAIARRARPRVNCATSARGIWIVSVAMS